MFLEEKHLRSGVFYTEISSFLPMLNDEELKWLREMNKNERGRFWEGKDYDWLWRKERKFVFIAGKSAGVTF